MIHGGLRKEARREERDHRVSKTVASSSIIPQAQTNLQMHTYIHTHIHSQERNGNAFGAKISLISQQIASLLFIRVNSVPFFHCAPFIGKSVTPLDAPTSQLQTQKTHRHLYRLYTSHFLATWGDRTWDFAIALFLIEIWPSSV